MHITSTVLCCTGDSIYAVRTGHILQTKRERRGIGRYEGEVSGTRERSSDSTQRIHAVET